MPATRSNSKQALNTEADPAFHVASLETTAALAQDEAPNVSVARSVSENAAKEHDAAEEAAKKARQLGKTGEQATSDTTARVSEAAHQTAESARGALNAASTKASEVGSAAAAKASQAYNAGASAASNVSNNASARAQGTAGHAGSTQTTNEGPGLVETLQSTATAAATMTGGYLASARDAASKVLESVLGTGAPEASSGVRPGGAGKGGVAPSSAQLESGQHNVDAPYTASKKQAGGGVNVAEVDVEAAPTTRN